MESAIVSDKARVSLLMKLPFVVRLLLVETPTLATVPLFTVRLWIMPRCRVNKSARISNHAITTLK